MPVVSTIQAYPRPYGETTPAVQLLYQQLQERQTGVIGVTLTLTNAPIPATFLLWKNGTLLDSAGGAGGYTLSDRTVTLGTAAIAGDVFQASYSFRATRTG